MPNASSKYKGEPGGIRVLRSVITPFSQMNARPSPVAGNEIPTAWFLLLMRKGLVDVS
jgi:hypothetical protein